MSTTPLQLGGHRQLFLDDWIVAEMTDLQRRPGSVVKNPHNPVLRRGTADSPWDSYRVDTCMNGFLDPAGKLRLYYTALGNKQNSREAGDCRLAYAESNDFGATWRKPNLGRIPYAGITETNLVLDPASESMLGCVFRDDHETDPARRYKMLSYEWYDAVTWDNEAGIDFWYPHRPSIPPPGRGRTGLHVAFSPDGYDWQRLFIDPVMEIISDVFPSVFWDTRISRYVAYIRGRRNFIRSAGRITSDDFLHWSDPELVILGKPGRELYTLGVTPYQGLYIGTAWIYASGAADHEPVIWPELAVSRDGIRWTRPFEGQSFIPLGESGRPDSRQIRMASSLVVSGDQIVLIYGQNDRPHVSDMRTEIGVATLRLDGFAGLEAGESEGSLLTKPLHLRTGRLRINAAVQPGGYVKAEVLAPGENQPLAGYEANHCQSFTGDSVNAALHWDERASLPATVGQLRFRLKQARLYSFWVE